MIETVIRDDEQCHQGFVILQFRRCTLDSSEKVPMREGSTRFSVGKVRGNLGVRQYAHQWWRFASGACCARVRDQGLGRGARLYLGVLAYWSVNCHNT